MVVPASGILHTKLTPPPVRADRISRPRLTQQFSASLDRPLTLVCAPAGYGKTTLVGDWLVSEAGRAVRLAWVSLDEDDNDPTRFLTYLVSALTTASGLDRAELLALLQSPQPPSPKVILTALMSRFEALPDRLTLVLDDYHLITVKPIHDALTFVLDHLPPRMCLVVTSREDPPLPLARLRARGQLAEIRADDLRFTPDEAGQFLAHMLGITLSAEHIRELDARTEGWIAGLQLAALAMKGRDDVAGFIAAFTGSHRYILDYLTEEVLSRQAEEVQDFLLQTSILSRLSGPLCDAVTGRTDGQTMLEQIEHGNLFLIALDDQRYWYRYHHLFADILRNRLSRTHPEHVADLHRRASTWSEQQGWLGEAVEYALAGQDDEQTARLVERYGERLRLHGEVATVLRWLATLPDDVLAAHPKLELTYAFMLSRTGPYSEAERRAARVEKQLLEDGRSADEAERTALLGQIAAIRATAWLQLGYDGNMTVVSGRQAFVQLPEADLPWRSWVALIVGITYCAVLGNMAEGERWLEMAVRLGEMNRDAFVQMTALFHLASIYTVQGRLGQAERACQTLVQSAAEPGWSGQPAAGYACLNRSWLRYERNDLAGALDDALTAHRVLHEHMLHRISVGSYVILARLRTVQGKHTEARELMQQAVRTVREEDLRLIYVPLTAWQAWLWLVQGDLDAATQWAKKVDPTANGDLNPALEFEHMTLARIQIAQGRLDEAQRLLSQLHTAALAAGRMGRVIAICVLQALAARAQGNIDGALKSLAYALTLGESEGCVRSFIDEGAPMAALLRQAKARGISVGYVTKLLVAFDQEASPEKAALPRPLTGGEFEPLSERELEVLRLIAGGASNREIAQRLVVSVGTVKKHLNNIFVKLDAHSRIQAITIARKQNLL